MKILVANLGSTSFKYRLYDMTDERSSRAAGPNGSVRPKVVRTSISAARAASSFHRYPIMPWPCGTAWSS